MSAELQPVEPPILTLLFDAQDERRRDEGRDGVCRACGEKGFIRNFTHVCETCLEELQ